MSDMWKAVLSYAWSPPTYEASVFAKYAMNPSGQEESWKSNEGVAKVLQCIIVFQSPE